MGLFPVGRTCSTLLVFRCVGRRLGLVLGEFFRERVGAYGDGSLCGIESSGGTFRCFFSRTRVNLELGIEESGGLAGGVVMSGRNSLVNIF